MEGLHSRAEAATLSHLPSPQRCTHIFRQARVHTRTRMDRDVLRGSVLTAGGRRLSGPPFEQKQPNLREPSADLQLPCSSTDIGLQTPTLRP